MAAPTSQEAPPSSPPEHKPFVPDKAHVPEFTWSAVLVGAVLGLIFGASSLYLVLKVGMTVSASIPVAVLSITLFRVFSRVLPFVKRTSILENNIVQTTGSAGESIAFGVGVTMPALMILGFEMDIGRVMVVSVFGGLLGILMMIPLRRAFIVKQHGVLRYPEGTACADVLIVGERGGATAKTVFAGFGIAFVFQFLRGGFKLFKDTVAQSLSWFKGAVPALETDPTLLGVGYIIGTRISCIMVGGGVLAAFVLIPAIRLFGDGLQQPLYPGSKLIGQMSEDEIQHDYILYIGAGAVAAGGIISLFQALPLIVGSLHAALRDIWGSRGQSGDRAQRTDRDLPLWLVGAGSILLVLAIWSTSFLHERIAWIPQLHMNLLGAVLIVVFGFLFVTVSSRLTGEIGSSSNPISGMTVATLLLTCLIFWFKGWTGPGFRVAALSVAAVVCIASSNGGTTSQDLKTGYLVGATPKWQQIAILIGSLSSALVIGIILIQMNRAYTVYSQKDLPTPKRAIDVTQLSETAMAPGDNTVYHVLRVAQQNEYGLPQGEYYVNDSGAIAYLVDPGINGKLTHRDDGSEVQRFRAPKAVLMAFITDGILQAKLPWTLVLLGVFISIVLELSGIPSLAFAVGVYLPLSTSTPIFAGGLVRYVADRWNRDRAAGARSEAEAEMSPGVLLSTGYIAGGAIAGVVIAFLNFSDFIPNLMSKWQYREYAIERQESLQEAAKELARHELGLGTGEIPARREEAFSGLTDEIEDLNSDLKPRYLLVPPGTTLHLPQKGTYTVERPMTLGEIAQQQLGSPDKSQSLFDLNLGQLIRVPADTTVLKLPDDRAQATNDREYWLGALSATNPVALVAYLGGAPATYEVKPGTALGDIATAALGDPDKAARFYSLNKDALEQPVVLPAGTRLKVPQQNYPALVAFGVLVLILTLVGLGWLMRSPPESGIPPDDGDPAQPRPITEDRVSVSDKG